MEEDQKQSLDILLKYGLIESSNRIDEYADTIDSVRSTAYGEHIYRNLSSAFTYLDLVSTDAALFESRVCNELIRLAQDEFEIWDRHSSDRMKRIERVEVRIRKTEEFIEYLEREEAREAELFGIPVVERFVPKIKLALENEIAAVRRSAGRQRY